MSHLHVVKVHLFSKIGFAILRNPALWKREGRYKIWGYTAIPPRYTVGKLRTGGKRRRDLPQSGTKRRVYDNAWG